MVKILSVWVNAQLLTEFLCNYVERLITYQQPFFLPVVYIVFIMGDRRFVCDAWLRPKPICLKFVWNIIRTILPSSFPPLVSLFIRFMQCYYFSVPWTECWNQQCLWSWSSVMERSIHLRYRCMWLIISWSHIHFIATLLKQKMPIFVFTHNCKEPCLWIVIVVFSKDWLKFYFVIIKKLDCSYRT